MASRLKNVRFQICQQKLYYAGRNFIIPESGLRRDGCFVSHLELRPNYCKILGAELMRVGPRRLVGPLSWRMKQPGLK